MLYISIMEEEFEFSFSDDIGVQELQSCQAIYPKSSIDLTHKYGSIDIPIKIDTPFNLQLSEGSNILIHQNIEHLPPIVLTFSLPENYPYEEPPQLTLTSEVLSPEKVAQLAGSLAQIWLDYKDQVIFSLIDYLHEQVQSNLGLLIGTSLDVTNPELYYKYINYNKQCLQQEFNDSIIRCDICCNDYTGTDCLKFHSCGHSFCNGCLHDYFTTIIISGEIEKVHCPSFECTKKALETKKEYSSLEAWTMKDSRVEEIITTLLVPSISLEFLLNILRSKSTLDVDSNVDSEELVQRFHTLFKKAQHEFISKLLPRRLAECPRIGCEEVIFRKDLDERLVICRRCQHAFCYDCRRSYHARFVVCKKIADQGRTYWGVPHDDVETYLSLSKDSYERKTLNARYGHNIMLRAVDDYNMEQKFNDMMTLSTSLMGCPTCSTVIEKTYGCNKMLCSQCMSHFCFVCGEITGPSYDHFSLPGGPCYGKLFFGMPGTEDLHENIVG